MYWVLNEWKCTPNKKLIKSPTTRPCYKHWLQYLLQILLQALATSTSYKPLLQALVTSPGYKHLLLAPLTSPCYKHLLQALATSTCYKHWLRVPVTLQPLAKYKHTAPTSTEYIRTHQDHVLTAGIVDVHSCLVRITSP